MKRTLLLAGLLLVASAVAGVAQPRFAHTATSTAGRTITVTGSGTSTTVPDRASFQFGVTTRAADAKTALARNSTATAAVIAALKNAGVAAADLQTSGISLSPQTNGDGTQITGYTASNSVSASLPLAKAGAVVDAAVNAGADTVWGPSLTVSDQSSLYRDALKKAVADAKAKAQALADAAGVQLGGVQSVDESGSSTPVPFSPTAKGGATDTPIEPGTQQITANVTVTYAVS
jgi:uncharacterized protein YggE